jgi:hypothetical protein
LSYKSAVYKLNNIPRMNIVFRFLYIIHHKMILYVLKDQSLVLILLDSNIGENVREGSWVAFFVCHYRWTLCLCLILGLKNMITSPFTLKINKVGIGFASRVDQIKEMGPLNFF